MSKDNLQKPCRQRFKGVENFLRRVAFNLGNTPSQTEVKIISCIPIDVTDLQQKIFNLEKQLYEAQQGRSVCQNAEVLKNELAKPTEISGTVEDKDLYGADFKRPSTVAYCNKQRSNMKTRQASQCRECSSGMKSRVSLIFPAFSTRDTEQTSKYGYCGFPTNTDLNGDIDRCKNIFRKWKKKRGTCNLRSSQKTHLVYYAQTPRNPFNLPLNTQNTTGSIEELCLTHLDNVIKRQYDPNVVIEEFSDTSNFTTPICRESGENCKDSHRYESDVCSCCHGTFQNLDNFMTSPNYDHIFSRIHNTFDDTKMYYDSKDYDIVPVKENPNKLLKEKIHKRENKMNIDFKCWPENFRTKYRYRPLIVNYQTETPMKVKSGQKDTQKQIKVKNKAKQTIKKRCNVKSEQQSDEKSSTTSSIECSQVYTKRNFLNVTPRKPEPVKVIIQKNEMVSTENVDCKLEDNTRSTQIELNTCDNHKTESTLDQIKTMLENVLAEVKTSAKLTNITEEKSKKDAVVQKGSSQNNLQGVSTLLHSFSYNNSYNANPYLSSCSPQLPAYCFGNMSCQPFKLQNYPVFVHPSPKRHMCACYYKNDSLKQTAAATNTENKIQSSNNRETEKLIKEIYKSMAANFDLTTKENSINESDDLKSVDGSTNTSELRTTGMVTSKRDMEVEALMTSLESNSTDSKAAYVASTQSDDTNDRNPIVNRYVDHDYNVRTNTRRNDIIVEDDETDNSDTDSDETVIVDYLDEKKNGKRNLFQRMFKSVKLFHKKKENQAKATHDQENEASDSDDYETIYSENSTRLQQAYKNRKNYAKVRRRPERNPTKVRSPYLEQEYRRQWDEKLIFSKLQRENSLEKHFTKSPYCSNYEVRTALINQKPQKTNKQTVSVQGTSQNETNTKKNVSWLKKHKFGINCGEQWKKFILES